MTPRIRRLTFHKKILHLGVFLSIIVQILLLPTSDATDGSQQNGTPNKHVEPPPPPPPPPPPSQSSTVFQLLEVEVWDAAGDAWKASADSRWTTSDGKSCKGPTEIAPPDGFQFVGDWKIVVQTGRDSFGWEYQFRYLQPATRQRIWLRTIQPAAPPARQEQSKEIQKAELEEIQTSKQTRNKSRGTKMVQVIKDEYNFKGFGVTLVKSFLSTTSAGVSFGLPLSSNFISWDRDPSFPSITSSLYLGFPWCIAGFLNGSLRVEWIKWMVVKIYRTMMRLLVLCVYQILIRGSAAIASVMVYPFVKRFYSLPPLRPMPPMRRPNYNPEISERIGVSISYRWSKLRGFEGRVSYWHSYLPTLVAYRRVFNAISRLPAPSSADEFGWWQAHFGSVGLSTGYPMPTPPHFSCSGKLSLSGFYFGQSKDNLEMSSSQSATKTNSKKTRKKKKKSSASSSSSSSTTISPSGQEIGNLEDDASNNSQEALLKLRSAVPKVKSKATI